MAGSKSYENPLLGHARMRALFRALVEVRALGQHVRKIHGLPKGLEACWVGTAIDLREEDVAVGLHAKGYEQLIRATGARMTDRATTSAECRRTVAQVTATRPFPGTASEEVCCAVGQAMALDAKNVVVAYVGLETLTAAEWSRVLAVAVEQPLPMVIVAIPTSKSRAAPFDLSRLAAKVAGTQIPVVPVDAGDAVALYRVMQETCIRARADGGVAMIECVRFGTDPVKLLADQLLKKGICSERWISKVEDNVWALQLLLQGEQVKSRRAAGVHSRGPRRRMGEAS